MLENSSNYSELISDIFNANERQQNTNPQRVGVTDLISSLKKLAFKKRVQFTYDIDDICKSFMGTGIHSYISELSRKNYNGKYMTDVEVSKDIDDITVAGEIDLIDLNKNEIVDFKNTSVWKYIFADYSSFEKQLNIYRYLLHASEDIQIDKLRIVMFFWDWSRIKAKTDHTYPQTNIIELTFDIWDDTEVERFLLSRIQAYKHLTKLTDKELTSLDICTDEEKMIRKATYAVKKPKRKTAVALFSSKDEAEGYIRSYSDKDLYIEERSSRAVCVDYCPVAKLHLCKFAEEQNGGI